MQYETRNASFKFVFQRILKIRFFDFGQIDAQSYCVDLLLFDGAQNVEFHRLNSHILRLETLQKDQIIQIQTVFLVFYLNRTL